MRVGRLILAFLLLTLAMVLAGPLSADTLMVNVSGQGDQRFENITVLELDRDGQGAAWLKVSFPDSSVHSLPLAQVRNITFGDNGEGRLFDAVVLNPENKPLEYERTLFQSFDGTRFVAQPPEEAEKYFLDPKFIPYMMATSDLPGGEPVGQGPNLMAEATPVPGASGEEVPKELQDLLKDIENQRGAGSSDDPRAALLRSMGVPEEVIRQMPAQSGASMLLGILMLIFMPLCFVTAVWSAVQAFRFGHTLWGLGIIFTIWSCCCSCLLTLNSLVKVFFMRAYEGPDKKVLNIVLTVEAFLGFAIIILAWMQ